MKIINKNTASIYSGFILMFVYGALLLMIGYTNTVLGDITNFKGHAILLAIPQSLGLVFCTVLLKPLLKKFNIRTLLLSGYFVSIIALVIICFLDKISGYSGPDHTGNIHLSQALFIVCSFLLGSSIGFTSPVISTYFASIFVGKKRIKMLSLVNGVYGVGAGIIPLVATGAIYGSGGISGSSNFNKIRIFYVIAIIFAAIGFFSSFMLDYVHSDENISHKSSDNNDNHKVKTLLGFSVNWFIYSVILVSAVVFFYMIAETISNYGMVRFFQQSSSSANSVLITSFRAFGLFIMVQGLWRCVSGLYVTKKVSLISFTVVSASLIIVAFILFLANIVSKNINFAYLIAIFMALGLGNCWSTIFSYGAGIDNKRAGYTGIWINITAMSTILLIQALTSGLVPSEYSSIVNTVGGKVIIIIGIISAALVIFLLLYLSKFLKKSNKQHSDDIKHHGDVKRFLYLITHFKKAQPSLVNNAEIKDNISSVKKDNSKSTDTKKVSQAKKANNKTKSVKSVKSNKAKSSKKK